MRKITYVFFIFSFSFLIGCGSSPQTFNINLNCDDNCNDNNAIVVRIYQLKNAERFRNSSFESLMRNPEEILADDIVPNSKYEKMLVPGETFQLKNLKILDNAIYLGVIGDFHSPSKDGWNQVIMLNQDIEDIVIMIHENYLTITDI